MKKLAGLRVTSELTQAEVAKILGIAQSTLSLWEKGASRPPLGSLPVLANLYAVSMQEILDALVTDYNKGGI